MLFPFSTTYSFLFFNILYIIFVIVLILGLALLLSKQNFFFEKITAYECGYEAFNDTHHLYDIRYFLIGLLFLIFDIELMFLFPWIFCLFDSSMAFFVGLDFLIDLFLSFLYGWYFYVFDWK